MKRPDLQGVASRAAARYARRVFWADPEDLKQEAMVAALTAAKRSFDPSCGVPLEAYAWRACMLHLRAYCWRQSSPVSETDHELHNLRGVHRLSLDKAGTEHLSTGEAFLDDQVSSKMLNDLIREQIDYLFDKSPHAGVARRVLIDEMPARHVAEEFSLPVVQVYRIARRARVLLSENAMLFELWRDT
jgi:DNA-directed RNA polymerase specialized sigma24 family protein